MRRKVIQIAGSTQLVSLPRKWALKQGIRKGDELEVEENGATLIIHTEGHQHVDRVGVDFDQFSPLTATCALDVLYKSGYEEIEINYSDKTIFKTIHNRLLQLIGCEVVEQTDKRVVIKDLTKGSLDSEFDSIFRRAFMITLAMTRNGLESLKSGQLGELVEFAQMEATNNKLVHYAHRILSKSGITDNRKAPLYYVVLWYLESVADDYRDLFNLLATKKKVSKEFLAYYETVHDYFDLFYKTFYKYDRVQLDKLYADRKKLIAKGASLFTLGKDDVEAIRLLICIPHNLFDILPIISTIAVV